MLRWWGRDGGRGRGRRRTSSSSPPLLVPSPPSPSSSPPPGFVRAFSSGDEGSGEEGGRLLDHPLAASGASEAVDEDPPLQRRGLLSLFRGRGAEPGERVVSVLATDAIEIDGNRAPSYSYNEIIGDEGEEGSIPSEEDGGESAQTIESPSEPCPFCGPEGHCEDGEVERDDTNSLNEARMESDSDDGEIQQEFRSLLRDEDKVSDDEVSIPRRRPRQNVGGGLHLPFPHLFDEDVSLGMDSHLTFARVLEIESTLAAARVDMVRMDVLLSREKLRQDFLYNQYVQTMRELGEGFDDPDFEDGPDGLGWYRPLTGCDDGEDDLRWRRIRKMEVTAQDENDEAGARSARFAEWEPVETHPVGYSNLSSCDDPGEDGCPAKDEPAVERVERASPEDLAGNRPGRWFRRLFRGNGRAATDGERGDGESLPLTSR
ncbi:hypothetical protein ACHAWF_017009 [Thalassiosira exigua]